MLEDRTTPTPVVSIVKGADAFEGVNNGSFILSRTGDTSQSLSVNISLSGSSTATPGQDYQYISSNVTFAANSATATINVNVMGSPYNDSYVENDETVILNIVGGGLNYTIGSPSSAMVIIVDNDTNAHDYYWTGAGGNPYWYTPANWTLDLANHTPASDAPHGLRDNIYFDGSFFSDPYDPNANSTGSGNYSGYNSLHMIHDYPGVVSLASASFGTFEQTGGTIDQPSAETMLVVTSLFTWTGGTLNSTQNLATVLITGSATTALFAPTDGGSMTLGSNITLDNEATATMKEGTVQLNKDGVELNVRPKSAVLIIPSALKMVVWEASQYWITKGIIWPEATWTVEAGEGLRFDGQLQNAGTVVLEPDALVELTGGVNDIPYSQALVNGFPPPATYLYGGSELKLTNLAKKFLIDRGILATVYSPDVGTGNATVTGDIDINNTDIYVNYGQSMHVNFGELLVDGNIVWNGGTFHPYVYAGGAKDVWRADGVFRINGGTIAPIYLDSDYGTSSLPTSGSRWRVLILLC